MDTRIDEVASELDQHKAAVDTRIDEVDGRLLDLQNEFRQGLAALTAEVKAISGGLEANFLDLKSRLEELHEVDMEAVRAALDRQEVGARALERRMQQLQRQGSADGMSESAAVRAELEEVRGAMAALKKQTDEHQLALEEVVPLVASWRGLMKRVQDSMSVEDESRAVLAGIHGHPYKGAFYRVLVQQLAAVHVAASVVQTDIVKPTRVGMAGNVGQVMCLLSSFVPVVGFAVYLFGCILSKVDGELQKRMIRRMFDVAGSTVEFDAVARRVGVLLLGGSKPLSEVLSVEELSRPSSLREKLENALGAILSAVGSFMSDADSGFPGTSSMQDIAEWNLLFVEAAMDCVDFDSVDVPSEMVSKHASRAVGVDVDLGVRESAKAMLSKMAEAHAGKVAAVLVSRIYRGDAVEASRVPQVEDKAGVLCCLVLEDFGVVSSAARECAAAISEAAMREARRRCGGKPSNHRDREEAFQSRLAGLLLIKQPHRELLEAAWSDASLRDVRVGGLAAALVNAFPPIAAGEVFKLSSDGRHFGVSKSFSDVLRSGGFISRVRDCVGVALAGHEF